MKSRTKNESPVHHPIFARVFERVSAKGEERGQAEHRAELLAGLSGRAIEVGAGNGLNFAHYPSSVEEVVAVEPERYLRERAAEAAEHSPVRITVVDGTAEELPAADESFDAGIASLVLCSVPDQGAALEELLRVIRPGGELRFYEHVRSTTPGYARVQRWADRLVWPRVAGGCHTARLTEVAIEHAGFDVESCRRFRFRPSPVAFLAEPHVLGSARRPEKEERR